MGSRKERRQRQESQRRAVAVVEQAEAVSVAPSLDQMAADALDWENLRARLAVFASSALGRRAVLELAPRDDDDARAALARTKEALALGDDEAPTSDLSDPIGPLARARAGGQVLGPDELLGLLAFLKATTRLSAWLEAHTDRAPRLAELGRGLPRLNALEALLEAGLDRRGDVRDDASPKLARLRRAEFDLTQRIEKKVKAIANRPEVRGVLAPGMAGSVHMRDGRAVLAVKAKSLGQVPGMVHDYSGSGDTAFVEPRDVIELGNELSAVRADVQHEVQRLLVEWTRTALEHEERIARLAGRMAQVELALVGKRYAERFACHVPEVATVAEGLVLRGARHPLLAWQVEAGELDSVVPLDLRLGDPFRVLVITGPNTGGKTLSMKTAGLAALFVRLGLPFPCAAGSKVPLYTGVVADIGDEQGVEQSLSTFSASLVRIAEGLERAGPRTLFLLDELGGGTDPADGAALGSALLEWLLAKQAPTIASTHIGRLKEFAFAYAAAENASVEFDTATLRPTYHLIVGAPGESRGLAIARRLGLPKEVLDRAEALVERGSDEATKLLGDIQGARIEAERSRSAAADLDARAAERLAELETERADLAARQSLLEDEAQRELELRLGPVRDGIAELTKIAAQVSGAARATIEERLTELRGAVRAASVSERRRAFEEGLGKGDFVYLPRHRKRCQVLKVDHGRGMLRVRLGRMDLEVRIDEATGFEEL
ncbi:Endonuclease MutS2 [Planctomycetes bacterium Pla163]|uniref:Endonuclease MutS2 n=1 Tax=Rohdeia mirabilis TaxID=2528008 RepID=A0A518D2W5_9BACT|nr:Endonuclease MutS2 [Planctomycetes bacterium Pla163]